MKPPPLPRFVGRGLALSAGALCLLALCEGAYRGALFVRARLVQDLRSFELYAVGGSTTQGRPFQNGFSFAAVVRDMYGGSLQGRAIAVRNLALYGEDSTFPQWVKLRREAAFRKRSVPGAALIYCGHNEGDLRAEETGLRARFWRSLERRVVMPSYLLTDLLYLARKARFCERERTPEALELYLREMARVCRAAGLDPIFATLASNLCDVEPNLPQAAPVAAAQPWVAQGRRLEAQGLWRQALAWYARARPAQPWLGPFLDYRSAKCLQALGRFDEARELFARAADTDSRIRFGRATRQQNAVVRKVAADSGAGLSDAAADFEAASPHGLVGRELFMDFHHPSLGGHLLIARGFARELGRRWRAAPAAGRCRDEADLRRAFRLGDGAMAQAWTESGMVLLQFACALYPWPQDRLAMARRDFTEALRLSPGLPMARLGLAVAEASERTPLLQDREAMNAVAELLSGRPRSAEGVRAILAPLRGRVLDGTLEAVAQEAEDAARRGSVAGQGGPPDGPRSQREAVDPLRLRAERLEKAGRPAEALALLRPSLRSDPGDKALTFLALRLAQAAGAQGEAADWAARAARLELDAMETTVLADAYRRLGRGQDALALLAAGLAKEPKSAKLHNDRAVLELMLGQPQEAADDLARAVALDADLGSAYLTLGGLQAGRGRAAQARATYARALSRERIRQAPELRRLLEEALRRLEAGPPGAAK